MVKKKENSILHTRYLSSILVRRLSSLSEATTMKTIQKKVMTQTDVYNPEKILQEQCVAWPEGVICFHLT